jgi:hypothetical protein
MSASAEVPTHDVVIFSANTSEPPKCSMTLGQVLVALQRSRMLPVGKLRTVSGHGVHHCGPSDPADRAPARRPAVPSANCWRRAVPR